jgi:hypothetical protein
MFTVGARTSRAISGVVEGLGKISGAIVIRIKIQDGAFQQFTSPKVRLDDIHA